VTITHNEGEMTMFGRKTAEVELEPAPPGFRPLDAAARRAIKSDIDRIEPMFAMKYPQRAFLHNGTALGAVGLVNVEHGHEVELTLEVLIVVTVVPPPVQDGPVYRFDRVTGRHLTEAELRGDWDPAAGLDEELDAWFVGPLVKLPPFGLEVPSVWRRGTPRPVEPEPPVVEPPRPVRGLDVGRPLTETVISEILRRHDMNRTSPTFREHKLETQNWDGPDHSLGSTTVEIAYQTRPPLVIGWAYDPYSGACRRQDDDVLQDSRPWILWTSDRELPQDFLERIRVTPEEKIFVLPPEPAA
jgi:hypothetical protein